MTQPLVTLSVVSHAQNELVNQLMADVARYCAKNISLVLTENVADAVPLAIDGYAASCERVVNPYPKGYGANHNAAFSLCRTPYFCIANPDLRLHADPFPPLLKTLEERHAGVIGPLVRSPAGNIEDSARRFPTPGIILRKLLGARPHPDYATDCGPIEVNWIAGMFMLFRSETYRSVGGFDEAYFLYYEDVDLCHRLYKAGEVVIYEPSAEVVHDARRASRRNLRLALHHLVSAFRFLSRS
jgi:hypothetical protein